MLRAKIAEAEAEAGDGYRVDKLLEAWQGYLDARSIRESCANGQDHHDPERNEFGHVEHDTELYEVIVAGLCRIGKHMYNEGVTEHRAVWLTCAKDLYAWNACTHGVEHEDTALSLLELGDALSCNMHQDRAIGAWARALRLALFMQADFIVEACRRNLEEHEGESNKTDVYVPTKRGHQACSRVDETFQKFYKCQRCHLVKYCSTTCQTASYANHKKRCKVFALLPRSGTK